MRADARPRCRVLRWLNAYGPGQKLYPIRKAVPVMILQALHDLDVEVWGIGTNRLTSSTPKISPATQCSTHWLTISTLRSEMPATPYG
jgi:hypothetical protein